MNDSHDMLIDLVSLITLDMAKLNAEVVHADNGCDRPLGLIYRIAIQLDEMRTVIRQDAKRLEQEEVKQAEVKSYAWEVCEVCDGMGIVYDDGLRPCECTGFLRFERDEGDRE